MKYFLTIIAVLSFSIESIKSQVITGRVLDAANTPIEFATVVLQTIDSVYVNSTITNSEGTFEIKSDLQKYRIILQHLLYETKEVESTNQEAGTIILSEKENMLAEVEIKGERPIIKVADGKLTYDMPRLLEGRVVSNAYESILQLPGVREQDGNIILAGANNLTVILNGKPSTMNTEQLANLLKNMPQSRIEKAEVMYSAPPQYHVRGAAINLIIKNDPSETPNFQGQINSAHIQKKYANFSSGATFSYSSSKFSTDFLYAVNQDYKKNEIDLYSLHTLNNSIYNIEQHNRGSNKTLTHNLRLGSDYNITDKDKISLIYTLQLTPTSNKTEKSNGNFSISETSKKLENPIQMHNIEIDYTSHFGFNVGANYTYYRYNSSQDFVNINEDELKNTFISYSNQSINRFNGYVDQTHDLSKDWTLDYGAKYSFASDDNSQTYNSNTSNNQEDIADLNSNSKVKEYTYDLYIGLKKEFSKKLSLSASLTGEYYQLGELKEWALFPYLEMSYLFSSSHILQLSLSSNKIYPNYWEMNGSISYLNGYTEIHGNPLLKPYKDYSTQLSYIIKGKYIITGYYSYLDRYFTQIPYQSSDRLALIYQTTNFDSKQMVGLNVVIPFSIGEILNSRATLNGFYDRAKAKHFYDISFDNSIWVFYSRLDNSIKLSKNPDIQVELSAAYITPNIQGPSNLTQIWNVDAGIKWTFAQQKAELRLKGADLFNSWSPNMVMIYADQNLKMNIIPDSRTINLSFSYKFGGYKGKNRKKVDTSRFGQ